MSFLPWDRAPQSAFLFKTTHDNTFWYEVCNIKWIRRNYKWHCRCRCCCNRSQMVVELGFSVNGSLILSTNTYWISAFDIIVKAIRQNHIIGLHVLKLLSIVAWSERRWPLNGKLKLRFCVRWLGKVLAFSPLHLTKKKTEKQERKRRKNSK